MALGGVCSILHGGDVIAQVLERTINRLVFLAHIKFPFSFEGVIFRIQLSQRFSSNLPQPVWRMFTPSHT
jgi:hypothetical protein